VDLGKINLEKDGKVVNLSTLIGKNDAVLVLLDPEKEPSKHILNDLGPYIDQFNKWGGQFVFAIPAEETNQTSVLKTYQLPAKTQVGIDRDENILNAVSSVFGSGLKDKLPLVLFSDSAGNIYLFSAGYKIGIGGQILKVISQIEASHKCVNAKTSCTAP
jgi:hypothetical protein